MLKEDLTDKQESILKFIKKFTLDNGFQPSMREIAEKMKITPSGVRSHLTYCEKKGYIALSGASRGIKFLKNI